MCVASQPQHDYLSANHLGGFLGMNETMSRKLICCFATAFTVLGASPTVLPAYAAQSSVEIAAKRTKHRGDVYLLRGFAGVFSRGLDNIGTKLEGRGVKANVIPHTDWVSATNQIIANQKRYGRKPVVLIGHSLGANAIIRMATELKKKRIRVDYMATFAATNPTLVPSNVRKITNYYFKTDGWGKPVKVARGFRGRLKNIDFSKSSTVGHFNIDKQPRLQAQVINNVLRIVKRRTSKNSNATAVASSL